MANDELDAEYERRYPNKRSGLPAGGGRRSSVAVGPS